MRVIHFADLHIGVETYGRPLPDRGWSSRMQDFLDAFDELVEHAISEHVDAVIFAGDAYKAREPGQTQQREFARRIRRLSAEGIATFLLVGNHDLPNAEGRAHVLEIFRTLDVPNVYVGDNAWFQANGFQPQVIPTRSGPLQVAFMPWPQVSRLLANDPAVASMSIEQQLQEVEKRLTALVAEQAAHLDPDIPSILTCHVSVNDFLVKQHPGTEQWMTIGSAPTVLKSALCEANFDYIALGHHHNNLDLEMNTPCWYSGSMQRVDFGEEGQPKGFMTFDLDAAKPHGRRIAGSGLPKLRQVAAREFVTVDCKPHDLDPTPEILRAIDKAPISGAIVRVAMHVTSDQHRHLRLPEVRQALQAAHSIAMVRPILPDDPRSRLPAGEVPDKASPMETLDLYLRVKEMKDEQRTRLKNAAADMLAELGVASA